MADKGFLVTLGICCLLAFVFAFPRSPKAAAPCPGEAACQLPACRCSSQTVPGGLTRPNTPQIVYLTFDDAITIQNYPFYEEVLFNRKNPNNASIAATFYITHEYTNYSLVHQLWRRGHEIALHSITHNPNTQYWQNLNESQWRAEIVDQREQMSTFAQIPKADIQGMRAAFLQPGGNTMYKALQGGGFTWECTRPTWNQRTPGLWPYTNDFLSTQDCQIPPCPDDEFKGFWTVPMIDMLGVDQFPCAMIDECTPVPMSTDDTYNLLKKNFDDQYVTGNRAPFGVFTHSAWLVGPDDRPEFAQRKAGYIKFLDYLDTLPDVYIVGTSQALEWIKNPVRVAEVAVFEPWKPVALKPDACPFPRNCFYENGTWERYMSSCVPCPTEYPWLNNHLGGSQI